MESLDASAAVVIVALRARLVHHPEGYPYSLGRTLAIYGGLMAAIVLASLDQTIVATALPVILGELGGLAQYSWVFTAFMLCSTVTVPIYGRLGDIYGRRRLFFISIPIFLVGSALCGLAQSMPELVVFRGIQGLGAGGVIPLAMATSGELVPPRERGRFAALISSSFLAGSLIGPTVGGLIVDNANWRWIFYLNLPIGAVALLVIALTMPRHERTRQRRVDYTGAVLLALGTTTLLLAVLAIDPIANGVAAAALGAVFAWHSVRAEAPIVPLTVVRHRLVATGAFATGLLVMAQFGAMAFVPLFTQGVLGASATSSGIVLIPQTVGAVAATIAAGHWMSRTGRYRGNALLGPVVMGAGMVLLALMNQRTTMTEVAVFMVVVGTGSGLMMQTFTIAAQNAVPVSALGAATSVIQFSRAIGTTVGVAIFGAIVNRGLAGRLRDQQTIVHRLAPAGRAALAKALHPAFFLGAGLCVVVLVAVWLWLEELPLRRSFEERDVNAST